jgi:hypothetical protein
MSMQQLLQSWTLSSYLNTKPPSPVITLSTNSTVGYALNQLATHNITSAPVFGRGTKTYYGFFDLTDVLTALLTLVSVRELTEENRVFKLRTAGKEHFAAPKQRSTIASSNEQVSFRTLVFSGASTALCNVPSQSAAVTLLSCSKEQRTLKPAQTTEPAACHRPEPMPG